MMLATSAVAQWVQTAGPDGGSAAAIFADGSNLYAGMVGNAGVFLSTDGGATWTQKINGMGYQSTTVINKSGSYLLASGTVGLYRSTDNGDTWTAATGLPGGNGVNSLAIDGANVIAGTSGKGVYVSTDNGSTWSAASTGLPGGGITTYVGSVIANGSTLLASATDNSVQRPMYRSTNLGVSWTPANTGLPADFSLYNAMYLDGSTVYAGGSFLYKTTNNGDNWTQAENGIPNYSGVSGIAASGSLGFAAAFNNFYRTSDGGSSWSPVAGGLPFMSFSSVRIVGSTVYAGTIANGVYKSTDNGATWTQMVTGLKARDMKGFLIDGSTLYANGNSIFKTTDDGATWNNVRGNLKDSSSMPTLVYVNGTTLFERDSPVFGLERSTDGGATWTRADNGLSGFYSGGTIISAAGALLVADGRIRKSTDNGDTWVQADSELTGFVGFSGLEKVGSTIYAYGAGVAKSTDDGTTWSKADSGIAAFFGVAGFAAVGPTLFAGGGFPNAIYKSTNNGLNWTTVTNLPSGGSASQLLSSGNALFACSPNNGIFVSTNLGSSWTKISTGLPNTNYFYTLAIHNGWMFAGTSGNSVWKRPLSDVVAVEEIPSVIPTRFALEQNYPNPFNPRTEIRFEITGTGFVSLRIYDVLGAEVATLINENLQPGVYQISWDASGKPSGVYYYRLRTGEHSEMKKMMLLK